MAALIPTPETLEDLIDNSSDINTFNDGIVAQADSPRTTGTDIITVEVTDDPFVGGSAYWQQKFGTGEWKRADYKSGANKFVSYTLPVNTATVLVHFVVYPWLLADIANYPAK